MTRVKTQIMDRDTKVSASPSIVGIAFEEGIGLVRKRERSKL